MGTCGSGVKTAGTRIIKARRKMVRCGKCGQEAICRVAFCAAVLGTATRRSSARPNATGKFPAAAITTSASVLPERSYLLLLNLLTSWAGRLIRIGERDQHGRTAPGVGGGGEALPHG